MNLIERKKDIEKLVRGLDISPTMHKNATEKYNNLAKYIVSKGIDCDIYPQGSFALGTVVRPYRDMKDADYDLDTIACIHAKRDEIDVTAKYTKNTIGDVIKDNENYKGKLEREWEMCWTLDYASVNEVGFKLDIIPSVFESKINVNVLTTQGMESIYQNEVIAITKKSTDGSYRFITCNPKSYQKWFHKINEPFLMHNRSIRLNEIMHSSNGFYNEIEEIPSTMERSALQRVIQLLKRHRDIYFTKARIKQEDKPISVIITTLVAKIADNIQSNIEIYDLLQYVVKELNVYSDYQIMSEYRFLELHADKCVIKKASGKWYMGNPVNPKDNLTDGWNKNEDRANAFFKWVKQLRIDFIDSLEEEDNQFGIVLGNAIGNDYFDSTSIRHKYQVHKPNVISNQPKHWSYNYVD